MTEFVLHIEQGQIGNKKHVREAFSNLKDGQYLVSIKWAKRRSARQNAYYHGIVCSLVAKGLKEAGYDEIEDSEDAHMILKQMFLSRKVINQNTGELLTEITGSTTKLTTIEFEEYMEKCRRFAAEFLGMSIPFPNEANSYFNQ